MKHSLYVCAINCTNIVRGFALIFCFKHFNRNRRFDSSLGKSNVITEKLNNFLIREKSFILGFWLGSEYSPAESSVFRSIHPEVFRKITFLEGFSKFLEKYNWRSPFWRSYRSKTGLFYRFYPVKQLLLIFFKLLHWELCRMFWYPCPSSM